MTATTVGIDVGGSSVKAVTRDPTGEILASREMPASFSDGEEIVEAAIRVFQLLSPGDCRAVGVGIPGQVDVDAGSVSLAVNLGVGVAAFDLAARLESRLGLPVVVENDVRAAVIGAGEILTAGGTPPSSLAFVSIGTGISAGVLVGGSLVRGSHGMAGEIGHVVLDVTGPKCPCGQRGCLETLVSGPAISRAWSGETREAAASGLFAAVATGDPEASRIAAVVTGHLTTALIWLAAAYDPELMALGGGVAAAGEPFLDSIRGEVARRGEVSELAARRLSPEQVVLVDPSGLPGARGAASIAHARVFTGAALDRTEKQERKQQGGAV